MSPPCIHPPGTILCIRLLMYDSLTPVLCDTPFSPAHNALKFAQVLGQVFVYNYVAKDHCHFKRYSNPLYEFDKL